MPRLPLDPKTLADIVASWKNSEAKFMHRALQYSQYAGFHPAWPQSMIAATFGFRPGDRRMLDGKRLLCVNTIGASSLI